MSQNPYTPRDPFGGSAPVLDVQPRVSGLAVASFVTSLLCCIPGLGAVAAVLGIGSLVSISRSQGRLGGRGLAFTAIVLGVLGTVLWLGLLIGASQMVGYFRPYHATMAAIEAGNWAGARAELTPAAAGALTDERLNAWREEYRKTYGNFREFPPGLLGLIKGYMAVGQGMQAVNQAQGLYPNRSPVPLPAKFDNGPGAVIFVMDQSQIGSGGIPRLDNIGIAGKGSGIIWLIDPSAKPSP